jgi:uncharacterized delta-60 repeat protein
MCQHGVIAWVEDLEARRFLSAGDLDRSFGTNGLVPLGQFELGPFAKFAPDGKIVLASGSKLMRFDADGRADGTFGSAAQVDVGFDIGGLAVQPGGGYVLSHSEYVGPQSRITLVRYTPGGALDKDFNNGAGQTSWMGGSEGGLTALADGDLVLAGETTVSTGDGGPGEPAFVVRRFNADGTVDTDFGQDGVAAGSRASAYGAAVPYDIIDLGDGRLEVVGIHAPMGGYETASSDAFDANGRIVGGGDFEDNPSIFSTGVRRDDGQVIIGGYIRGEGYEVSRQEHPRTWVWFESQYKRLGLDFDPRQGQQGYPRTMINAGDNRILVAGDEGTRAGIVRLNADGSPDASFGFGGATTLSGGRGQTAAHVRDMRMTQDGDVLALVQYYRAGNGSKLYLAKIEGGTHDVGQRAPVGAIAPPNPDSVGNGLTPTRKARFFQFPVRFAAERAIDVDTLGDADVIIKGPRGFAARAKFLRWSEVGLGRQQLDAIYSVHSPGKRWDPPDNGVYTVYVRRRSVRDDFGHAMAAGAVGYFQAKFDAGGAGARAFSTSRGGATIQAVEITAPQSRRGNDVLGVDREPVF